MNSPFKFLDSFTKEDKDIFFGRDKEIEELYSRVFESNLLLVYGVSGTGKSSLINCGLANKFADTDWLPINIRRGSNIKQSLVKAISKHTITPLSPGKGGDDGATILNSLKSLYLDHFKPIYLIFDQFEELFIFGRKDERDQFVKEVTNITSSDLNCRFIFVLRGEYLENITEFEEAIPTFFQNRMRVEKMTRQNAADCIAGPCKTAGIEVEDGFPQKLLEKLSPDKAEIELTYLQVFLDKLYKKSVQVNPKKPVFTNKMLEELGRIGDVLSDFLEEQIAELEDSEAGLSILKAFVSLEGTKKQIGLEEITEFTQTLGKDIPRAIIESNVHQFVDLRILRDKDENEKYELRHDSLAEKIYAKITLVEKELLEVRQFLLNSLNEYEKRGLYLREDDLIYIAPYEDKLFLNKKLQKFIERSKGEIQKVKRRKRSMAIAAVAALLVIFGGFSIWALNEQKNAKESSEKHLESLLMLNESAEKASKSLREGLNDKYGNFIKAASENPKKAGAWKSKAFMIRDQAETIYQYIEDVKIELVIRIESLEADERELALEKMKTNGGMENKSNVDIPGQMMIQEERGVELKEEVNKFKEFMISMIKPKDGMFKSAIANILNTDDPQVQEDGIVESWESERFEHLPAIAVIYNMSEIQSQVRNAEVEIISYLLTEIEAGSLKFNKVSAVVIPQSNYITVGDSFRADVYLVASDSMTAPAIYIGDYVTVSPGQYEMIGDYDTLIIKGGKGKMIALASQTGTVEWGGIVNNETISGIKQYPFHGTYQVVKPGISVTPVKQNVFYIGTDNPVQISVPGFPANKIKPSISGAGASIREDPRRPGSGGYIVNVRKTGEAKISVAAEIGPGQFKNMGSNVFRAKRVPDPVAYFMGKKGSTTITKADLLAGEEIEAILKNFDFDVKFKVTYFHLSMEASIISDLYDSGVFVTVASDDNRITPKMKKYLSKAKKGTKIYFEDIMATEPDGSIRKLGGIILTVN